MRQTLIFILTIFLLQSCGLGDGEQVISVDNKYSLSIPSFLTKTNDLNVDASLQYQHIWKEFYVVVIDESKEELQQALIENDLTDDYENDIEGYSRLILEGLMGAMSNPHQAEITDTTINKMPAKLATIHATIDGIDAFYAIGIYAGEENYYQVYSWSLRSNEQLYQDKMNRVLYSLQELKSTENIQ